MQRDGYHQTAVHRGVAPYKPNSLDGGCPFTAGADAGTFVDVPVELPESVKVRAQSETFDDHFSQPRRFWLSMTPIEREHIIAAYTFELGKCYEQAIKERNLQILANIDPVLCSKVAEGLGLPAPEPTVPLADVRPSPALSQVGEVWPTDGRMIGIVAAPDADLAGVAAVREAVLGAGMVPLIVAPTGGPLGSGGLKPQRTFTTARSTEFDAVMVVGSPAVGADAYGARDAKATPSAGQAGPVDPRVTLLLAEAFRHGKAIGAWGGGDAALAAAGVPADAPGVVVGTDGPATLEKLSRLMGSHRVWERFPTGV
jgi:catalase